MNFIKRIFMLVYMVLMLGAGLFLLAAAFNIITAEQWTQALGAITANPSYQMTATVIGGIFVLLGVLAPYRMSKGIKKNRVVSFQNPDGEVSVSLSAIEDYIRKVARGIPGIRDMRSHVDIGRRGVNIITSVSMAAGANIPEVTEKIQAEVKEKVRAMLGIDENINMKIHISKLLKDIAAGEYSSEEEPSEPTQIPYR